MLCSLAQPPCRARHLYLLVVEFETVITPFVSNVGQAQEDVQEVCLKIKIELLRTRSRSHRKCQLTTYPPSQWIM